MIFGWPVPAVVSRRRALALQAAGWQPPGTVSRADELLQRTEHAAEQILRRTTGAGGFAGEGPGMGWDPTASFLMTIARGGGYSPAGKRGAVIGRGGIGEW